MLLIIEKFTGGNSNDSSHEIEEISNDAFFRLIYLLKILFK